MYRTATLAAYDVLDVVMVNITVTEYPDLPGTTPPSQFTYSTTVPSIGDDQTAGWIQTSLQGLLRSL